MRFWWDNWDLGDKSTSLLQIHHLAVNSLLKSSQVNEVEGGDMFSLDKGANCGEHWFDETLSCGRAFRVLKQLVNRCISDAISSGNEFADALLQHVYRWLCRHSC